MNRHTECQHDFDLNQLGDEVGPDGLVCFEQFNTLILT